MKDVVKEITSMAIFNTKENNLIIEYQIVFQKSIYNDTLIVHYNDDKISTDIIDTIFLNNYFKIFLAQLFLSETINNISCKSEEYIYFTEVLSALWRVRNLEEKSNFIFKGFNEINYIVDKVNINAPIINELNVLNLVSGGKDSFASDILLAKNKRTIYRCYLDNLNIKSNEKEKEACSKLYPTFQSITLIGFERLVNLAVRTSDSLGDPPNHNFIPRGRDILSIIFALPYAIINKCAYISHSCERDLWLNNKPSDNGFIPLHDSQSKIVISAISAHLKQKYGIGIFSPIAGMSEYYILSNLFNKYPNQISQIQSCFYGDWCSECKKCIRYYLIQQRCGVKILNFNDSIENRVLEYKKKYENAKDEHLPYYIALCDLFGIVDYSKELFKIYNDDLFPVFFTNNEL